MDAKITLDANLAHIAVSAHQRAESPTNALLFNSYMWSKVLMLKLPVEETKVSISDMTPGTP